MKLGQGSYGEVTNKKGLAVKKFTRLHHLIQEYTALRYLKDTSFIVKERGVDFSSLELSMDLYDCNLRTWLVKPPEREIPKSIQLILRGLCELHDRGLAHGDLKPSNILVKKNKDGSLSKLVLGDCGFVSIAKYAKVERTAAVYRDTIISHDPTHDMFSFGICLLEMVGNVRMNRQGTYEELRRIAQEKISDEEYKKIILALLHSNREKRPTARFLLNRLFGENPPPWSEPRMLFGPEKFPGKDILRKSMKETAREYDINRGKKGYGALLAYVNINNISSRHYKLYVSIVLMVLSALFGNKVFGERDALKYLDNTYSVSTLHEKLETLLYDENFLNILLAP